MSLRKANTYFIICLISFLAISASLFAFLPRVTHVTNVEGLSRTLKGINENGGEISATESGQKINDAMVIPVGKTQDSSGYNKLAGAYRYVFQRLSDFGSDFIAYPYSYAHYENDEKTDVEGALIQLKSSSYSPAEWQIYINRYRRTFLGLYEKEIDLVNAQALYDKNVAVFRAYGTVSGLERDLTYESGYFCNALHTWLGKYSKCFKTVSEWKTYKENPRAERTSFVYVSPGDVRSGFLSGEYEPEFGILFLPDVIVGTADDVLSQLGQDGANALISYVNQGGLIYASGKSAYLLEKIGLLNSGTVDTSRLITPVKGSSLHVMSAKDDHSTGSIDEWTKRILIMGLLRDAEGAGAYKSTLLTSYPLDAQSDNQLHPILSFDLSEIVAIPPHGVRDLDGEGETPFPTDGSVDEIPALAYKKHGETGGGVILNAGQVLTKDYTLFPFVLNSMLAALASPMLATKTCSHTLTFGDIAPDYFPGNEAGIRLNLEYKLRNLHANDAIYNSRATIGIRVGFEVLSAPSSCVLVSQNRSAEYLWQTYFPGLNLYEVKRFDSIYECTYPRISSLSTVVLDFNLEIVDAAVTRAARQIPVAYGMYDYTYQHKESTIKLSYTLIQAYQAARLVGDYTVDPSGLHPLPGEGDSVSVKIALYNKENTAALDVETIAVIPLVTPLYDSTKQTEFVVPLNFWADYYKVATNEVRDYNYPLHGDTDEDYLDFHRLADNSASLVAEWGDPVGLSALNRGDPKLGLNASLGVVDLSKIYNARYSYDIDTANEVVVQSGYRRSVKQFEHAQPRLFAFTDKLETTPAGDPKIEVLLARSDLHFATVGSMPLPDGVSSKKIVVSVDDQYPSNLGSAPAPGMNISSSNFVHEGYFSSAQGGLDPDVYWNDLMQQPNSTLELVSYSSLSTDPLSSSTVTSTGSDSDSSASTSGHMRATHYLVPMPSEVKSHAQVVNFENSGHLEFPYPPEAGKPASARMSFPSVSILEAMRGGFQMTQSDTYWGGKFTLKFEYAFKLIDGSRSPLDDDRVTFAVEHIAIFDKDWNEVTKTLTIYFRRGMTSYERNSKSSEILFTVEGMDLPVGVNTTEVEYTLYALTFDFGSASTGRGFDTYSLVEEQDLELTMRLFLRLPAVEVKYQDEHADGSFGPYGKIDAYNRLYPGVSYNLFFQEMQHRQLYGIDEAHHLAAPGVSLRSKMFSGISTLGTGSIPYQQLVNTGSASLLIPFSPSTSRYEWKDVWGRKFAQPVRSTLVDSTSSWETRPGGQTCGCDVSSIAKSSSRSASLLKCSKIIRNFMVSSTYQLLHPETGERIMDWSSDEKVDAHVQVKIINNYPRFFDPTVCGNNEIMRCGSANSRVYDLEQADAMSGQGVFHTAGLSGEDAWVTPVADSIYGNCWSADDTVLQGVTLDATERGKIFNTSLCKGADPTCTDQAGTDPNYILRSHWKTDDPNKRGKNWNFSPLVNSYFPDEYTEAPDRDDIGMWDMSRELYSGTWYNKGYPWHMDNHLPSFDNDLTKPENILEVPVFKGFGFFVEYDNEATNPFFTRPEMKISKDKKGWWCDSLQARDDSLLAGQTDVNPFAVGSDLNSLMNTEDDFIHFMDLEGCSQATNSSEKPASLSDRQTARASSFYTCMFNPRRLRVDMDKAAEDRRYSYPTNVYQNYIVPTPSDISSPDSLLKTPCTDPSTVVPYTPSTISQYTGNYKDTGKSSAIDYMFFAAALRGGSKESMNVLLHLSPPPACDEPEITRYHYEGNAKIYEGSRFVYRNPANGPNSYTVVNESPLVAMSSAVDLLVIGEVMPATTTTFCSEMYMLMRVEDHEEVYRRFVSPFIGSYGYGDYVTTLYAGDFGTSAILPYYNIQKAGVGATVIVRVEFRNNAGFDMCLTRDAMEWSGYSSEISGMEATDCLSMLNPDVQAPTKYNFLTLVPQREGMFANVGDSTNTSHCPFILGQDPSLHLANVEPVFFDFLGVNPTVIRDGFTGSYFFAVNIQMNPEFASSSVPTEWMGHVYDFDIRINSSYFNRNPGQKTGWNKDPTNEPTHDYSIEFPPLKLAIGDTRNRAYWTLGRAHDVRLSINIFNGIQAVTSLLLTNPQNVARFRSLVSRTTGDDARTQFDAWAEDSDKLIDFEQKPQGECPSWDEDIEDIDDSEVDTSLGAVCEIAGLKKRKELKKPLPNLCGTSSLTFDFSSEMMNMPEFPSPPRNGIGADTAQAWILTSFTAGGAGVMGGLPFGTVKVGGDIRLNYTDFNERSKFSTDHNGISLFDIDASGAALVTTMTTNFVDSVTHNPIPDEFLIPNSTNTLMIELSVENTGSNIAFGIHLESVLGTNVTCAGVDTSSVVSWSLEPIAGDEFKSLLIMDFDINLEPGNILNTHWFVQLYVHDKNRYIEDESSYNEVPPPVWPPASNDTNDSAVKMREFSRNSPLLRKNAGFGKLIYSVESVNKNDEDEEESSSSSESTVISLVDAAALVFDLTQNSGSAPVRQPLTGNVELAYSLGPSSLCDVELYADVMGKTDGEKDRVDVLLISRILPGCNYKLSDVTMQYSRQKNATVWEVVADVSSLEAVDSAPKSLFSGGDDVNYRVIMMRQPDPLMSSRYQVGKSGQNSVEYNSSTVPWGPIIFVSCMILGVLLIAFMVTRFELAAIAAFTGYRAVRRYRKRSPFSPQRSQKKKSPTSVDKRLAKELNSVYRDTGMGMEYSLVPILSDPVTTKDDPEASEEGGAISVVYRHHNTRLSLDLSSNIADQYPAAGSRSSLNLGKGNRSSLTLSPLDLVSSKDGKGTKRIVVTLDDGTQMSLLDYFATCKVLSGKEIPYDLAKSCHRLCKKWVRSAKTGGSRPDPASLLSTAYEKGRGFQMHFVDDEWKKLMAAAGLKSSTLRDPLRSRPVAILLEEISIVSMMGVKGHDDLVSKSRTDQTPLLSDVMQSGETGEGGDADGSDHESYEYAESVEDVVEMEMEGEGEDDDDGVVLVNEDELEDGENMV